MPKEYTLIYKIDNGIYYLTGNLSSLLAEWDKIVVKYPHVEYISLKEVINY